MRDLKSWTSHTLFPSGTVIIDQGAHTVLSRRESGGRLLAAGVVGVIGAFASGQAVRIAVRHFDASGNEGDSVRGTPLDTRPSTPNLVAAASMSSSIASLEPLSRFHSMLALVPEKKVPDEEGEIETHSEADVIEIGRGLANYNSAQISKVKGMNRYDDVFGGKCDSDISMIARRFRRY